MKIGSCHWPMLVIRSSSGEMITITIDHIVLWAI